MTETDTRKIAVGTLLLLISTLLIFGTGTLGVAIPAGIVAASALGLAAGALLVGTSSSGRPV